MAAGPCLIAVLGGCASTPAGTDLLRQQRDTALEKGDFLAAVERSREIYRGADAGLGDVTAHCGLSLAIAQYTQARACLGRLSEATARSVADVQRELVLFLHWAGKKPPTGPQPELDAALLPLRALLAIAPVGDHSSQLARHLSVPGVPLPLQSGSRAELSAAAVNQRIAFPPGTPAARPLNAGRAEFTDRLRADWPTTRAGVEAQLLVANVRWRTLYLAGKLELETGDFGRAHAQLKQGWDLVHRSWPVTGEPRGPQAVSLVAFIEQRETWLLFGEQEPPPEEITAWLDLMASLVVAAVADGDRDFAGEVAAALAATPAPRVAAGYKSSRLAYAHVALGDWARARQAVEADPEAFRRALRQGGTWLSTGVLLGALATAATIVAAPAVGFAGAFNGLIASLWVAGGLLTSSLTLTFARVAGSDSVWDRMQRWYASARIAKETGEHAQAREAYQRLLDNELLLQSQPAIQWQVYADMAELSERDGHVDEAIMLLSKAVEVIEATRRNIAAESAKIGFFADKQRVYRHLMRLLIQRGEVAAAFEFSERARARALLDLLAGRDFGAGNGEGAPAATPGPRPTAATDWAGAEGEESDLRLAALQARADEVQRRRGTAVQAAAQVQREAPELASLTSVTRYRAAQIQALLDEGEVLVSFFPLGEEVVAFGLTRQRVVHWLMPAAGLDQAVRELRENVEARRALGPGAQRLAAQLFQGLPAIAPAGLRRITVVPTGPLHVLPFAALEASGALSLAARGAQGAPATLTGGGATAAAWRVLPSASLLPLAATRAKGGVVPAGVVAFGNPDFGGVLTPLPAAEAEARQVVAIVGAGRAVTGRAATREAVVRALPEAGMLHLATHGRFDSREPLQSALMFSDGKGGVAALTAADLYGLRMAARLVTLSACETGLGEVRSGDEVIGLYRALMFAGARTIVASLWEVDDASTAFLMVRFYEHLRSMPAPEALRRAQTDTAVRWPAPYFWAGFSVIGMDRPLD